MSLSFGQLPQNVEQYRKRVFELEQQEVNRGLLRYLLRHTAFWCGLIATIFSGIALWRSYHPAVHRPSAEFIILQAVFWLTYSTWVSFWEFRRKQKRVGSVPIVTA